MTDWIIKKTDLSIEKQIATAFIVSTPFIRAIIPAYNPSFSQSDFCRLIIRWAIDFYSVYKECPNYHIQDVYNAERRAKRLEGETSRLIAAFLRDLSERYEQDVPNFNHRVILDAAVIYFQDRALQLHVDKIQALREAGEYRAAEAEITNYRVPMMVAHSAGKDFLTDKDSIIEAFAEEDEDEDLLFQLSGALGQLIGPFYRDDFIAVAGPMGRGKTWCLQYIALEALLANLDVAFFSMGDMTIKQMKQRFHRMLVGLPRRAGTYLYPVWDCHKNQTGICTMRERKGTGRLISSGEKPKNFQEAQDWVPCVVCKGERNYRVATWVEEQPFKEVITWSKALKRGAGLRRMLKGRLMLEAWPRKMGGFADIRATLDIWRHHFNFVPSVIVTDYADIMKDESRSNEYRHQLNWLWEAHDSLAKETHSLVVSATQTDRSTYRGDTNVGGDNISEDIRKLAHVSTMFALNQSSYDKQLRRMRISIIKSRHEDCDQERECYVLQQFDCGQFCIDSYTE